MTLPLRHASNDNNKSSSVNTGTHRRKTVREPSNGHNEPTAARYDTSNGYPKNLPEGPEAVINIKGKKTLIHGIPWEKLDDETRKDLDDKPLDDAGQLRIFIKDSFTAGSYIELGSEARAEKFRNHLHDMGRKLL